MVGHGMSVREWFWPSFGLLHSPLIRKKIISIQFICVLETAQRNEKLTRSGEPWIADNSELHGGKHLSGAEQAAEKVPWCVLIGRRSLG